MKKGLLLGMIAGMAVTCSCFAEQQDTEDVRSYENGGYTLSVPAGYADELLIVEVLENRDDGKLFRVSEKASVEAAEAMGEPADSGAGFLFAIGTVSEDRFHEMLCYDMSGEEVFARDAEDSYFIYYHPTDVRIVRESNEELSAGMPQWSMLNEWAATVGDTFIEENDGLTAESRGNTMPEMYLNRTAYSDDTYNIRSLAYGPMEPAGVDAEPYVLRLTENAKYEYVNDEEAPDGEYMVLYFPEDKERFDFFFMEGKENYVRRVKELDEGEEYEELYKATFADQSIKASAVMAEWYDALAAESRVENADYTADDLVGTWAEKIAGRGMITIAKSADEGKYDIRIDWSGSAFEMNTWIMTAEATGESGRIRYENGKYIVTTFTEEDEEGTSETKYENGTGSFYLNNADELMWQDETGNAADESVFIRAK